MVLLEILKLPAHPSLNQARPKKFGRENLYLELIENKSKLRKNVRKDFDYDAYGKEKEDEAAFERYEKARFADLPYGFHATPGDSLLDAEESGKEDADETSDREEAGAYDSPLHESRSGRDDPETFVSDKYDKSDKTDKYDKYDKTDKTDKTDKYDKYGKSEEGEKDAKASASQSSHPLPSLEDLKKSGQLHLAPTLVDAKELEKEDRRQKRALVDKIERLRPRLKNYEVPPFSIHSQLDELKEIMAMIQRRSEVQRQKETYKVYLTMFYMVVELAGSRYFSMDTKGYCSQQMAKIADYEDLLEELGEESVDKNTETASATSRLLWAISGNTLLFFANKMMSSTMTMTGVSGKVGGGTGSGAGGMGGMGVARGPSSGGTLAQPHSQGQSGAGGKDLPGASSRRPDHNQETSPEDDW